MTYLDFYNKMHECKLISAEWRNMIALLNKEIDGNYSDEILKLFILYFSLIDDGNTYMSLDNNEIIDKFKNKINQQKAKFIEDENGIDTSLDDILNDINAAVNHIDDLKKTSVIGKYDEDKLFVVDEENCRLFAKKYYKAVESIKESVLRLFNASYSGNFDVGDKTNNFTLEDKQKDVVTKGINYNLIVTGGPGTGKTTSILFLLLGLLSNNADMDIYLTAPSGKAAARISESIGEDIKFIKNVNDDIVSKIINTKGQTIHRLLKIDRDTNGFVYNKEHQFAKESIFVIDEASMIDVCLFASLLEAIPTGARVFILGDKNQLPSVECGAVFADLLEVCKNNVIELTKTKRFDENSDIFILAEKVNSGNLNVDENKFSPIDTFSIEDNSNLPTNSVFFYKDNEESNRAIVDKLTTEWYEKYYKDFKNNCKNLTESDTERFQSIARDSEKAKILCAQNESTRGTENVNKKILEKFYAGHNKTSGFYTGEILMITRNLKSLDLFNGDCGATVNFQGDETLYFMIEKVSDSLNIEEGKKENKIFKIQNYYFYPIRMIGRDDIVTAFAITIHKSQGSGYGNVFIVLPKTENHPLLNRQLLYTAITRTKGDAYIISNKNNLEYASINVLKRDTGVFG